MGSNRRYNGRAPGSKKGGGREIYKKAWCTVLRASIRAELIEIKNDHRE